VDTYAGTKWRSLDNLDELLAESATANNGSINYCYDQAGRRTNANLGACVWRNTTQAATGV